MKGFNLIERGKLIISLKKSNIFQLKELNDLVNAEIERRKKKEKKGIKKL